MLKKKAINTRLNQNKNKTYKKKKKQLKEREESDRITWSPFSSKPWKTLSFD